MEAKKLFVVVGTDARQAAAGRVLERAGYAVGGAEQVALADYILLPLPLDAARTPLAELLRAAKPGAVALGGRLSVQAKTIAQKAGVELVDYFARPELTVYNAIPTAEGCIGILLAERTRTLWGTNLLLLGFGPVGQAVGTRLAALGAHVTVAARRPAQRAQAESLGMQGAELARLARLSRLAWLARLTWPTRCSSMLATRFSRMPMQRTMPRRHKPREPDNLGPSARARPRATERTENMGQSALPQVQRHGGGHRRCG